jgi:hypothetical protein
MRWVPVLKRAGQATIVAAGILVASATMTPRVLGANQLAVLGGNNQCKNTESKTCGGTGCTSTSTYCRAGTVGVCSTDHQPLECNVTGCTSHTKEICN